MAAKKITLASLATLIEKGFASIEARTERGFAAVADDIADIKHDMARKDQIIALHTQVNSIETDLRGMKHVKLETRVADLEDKVVGNPRHHCENWACAARRRSSTH